MPDKHPDAERHGGPGSSHQNRQDPSKSAPTGRKGGGSHEGPDPGSPTNPDHSRVSGGGGERDRHHVHHPAHKS
ncbi:hypothetical protein CR162_10195 [Pseudoroseomonas rhizosphaerae]|uniref:Uncharacterized protein n=1 Tax=Teichococcus rhizosphaerae TaxID=1335062 RepID=A0A2C7AEL8_9PROT|nr:hypothetical protein [Pseudoroseomonas rhizosphaerae]PHK95107.1 hypothetical protein CR162_10195 [Pseudoroseomonas rhizosphaerae]